MGLGRSLEILTKNENEWVEVSSITDIDAAGGRLILRVNVDNQSDNMSFSVSTYNDWIGYKIERYYTKSEDKTEVQEVRVMLSIAPNLDLFERTGYLTFTHNCAKLSKTVSITQDSTQYIIGVEGENSTSHKFNPLPDTVEKKEFTITPSGGSKKWYLKGIEQYATTLNYETLLGLDTEESEESKLLIGKDNDGEEYIKAEYDSENPYYYAINKDGTYNLYKLKANIDSVIWTAIKEPTVTNKILALFNVTKNGNTSKPTAYKTKLTYTNNKITTLFEDASKCYEKVVGDDGIVTYNLYDLKSTIDADMWRTINNAIKPSLEEQINALFNPPTVEYEEQIAYDNTFKYEIDKDKLTIISYGQLTSNPKMRYDFIVCHKDINNTNIESAIQKGNKYEQVISCEFSTLDDNNKRLLREKPTYIETQSSDNYVLYVNGSKKPIIKVGENGGTVDLEVQFLRNGEAITLDNENGGTVDLEVQFLRNGEAITLDNENVDIPNNVNNVNEYSLENNKITLPISPNQQYSARQIKVNLTFKDDGIYSETIPVTIIQSGLPSEWIFEVEVIEQQGLNIEAIDTAGTTFKFTIESTYNGGDKPFSVYCQQGVDWLSFTTTKEENKPAIAVTVQPNNGEERSANIYFKQGGGSIKEVVTRTIIQYGKGSDTKSMDIIITGNIEGEGEPYEENS